MLKEGSLRGGIGCQSRSARCGALPNLGLASNGMRFNLRAIVVNEKFAHLRTGDFVMTVGTSNLATEV
jgi:hypothetical protein